MRLGYATVLRHEDRRDVGFFLFVAGWIVVVFANSGVIITDSLMIILGADMLIAGLAMQTKIDALKQLQAQTQVELNTLLPSMLLGKVCKGK